MGKVIHWVNRLDWSLIIVGSVLSLALVQAAEILSKRQPDNVTVTVNVPPHKPITKVYEKVDGQWRETK